MASIRKLTDGGRVRWKATVTFPDGRQRAKTDPLKGTVTRWAADLEVAIRQGTYQDERPALRTTLAEWHGQWARTRVVSENTRRKNATHWRVHLEPRWGRYGLSAITRTEVKTWVADMTTTGVGVSTIEAVVTLLSKILADAVDAGLLRKNVAARLPRPSPELKVPFFWTQEEARAIAGHLDAPWDLLVLLACHTGLRMGESRGLRVEQVDLARGQLHVTRVETRQGPVDYPKGKDRRSVPIPPALLPRLAELMAGRDPLAYVFAADGSKPIDDRMFHRRLFEPARAAAGARPGTPHDMRHTAASWLVMAGVDLYRVQALLGHKDARTTTRYAHLEPGAFDQIHNAWHAMAQPGH